MTKLVIVESPAKCSKIQGFLGFGWRVIASLGHIRHLKEDLESIGLTNDFNAKWEFMKEKAKAVQQIKDAAKDAEVVYLASDDDREGELIAYSICLLLHLDPQSTKRIIFHEITKTAILQAIETPTTVNMNKVNAAQARAILDMMVGFTISPLLWKNIGSALSAGRCQTPALRIVCEREKEITAFQSSSSWKINGKWSLEGKEEPWSANLNDDLEDEESARNYLELHSTEPGGEVLKVDTKGWKERPPQPLITSTLQQQASSLFRINPKDTMKIAQRLYEAGHITYMRTDKAVLSGEAVAAANHFVSQTYGPQYVGVQEGENGNGATATATGKGKGKKAAKDKEKKSEEKVKAQEAHEAIRPTHIEEQTLPEGEDWSARDRKVYSLIWMRTLQSTMTPATGEERIATFVADGDDKDDFTWNAKWRRTLFDGWKIVSMKEERLQDSSTEENNWNVSSQLVVGSRLHWNLLQGEPYETKPPTRYTEASLIRELEQRGIGRPSTFAALISTILDKQYVEVQNIEAKEVERTHLCLEKPGMWPPSVVVTKGKVGGERDKLSPTPLGNSVLDFCVQHFEDLFNYNFTAKMESRLDKIAEGGEEWKEVLRETWESYKDRYMELKNKKSQTDASNSQRRREFGGGIVAVVTKTGPVLLQEDVSGDKDKTVFYGWPEGLEFADITAEVAMEFIETEGKKSLGAQLGEYGGFPVIRKKGKFGIYAEWNGKTTSCTMDDSLETIVEKFNKTATNVLRVVGQFEIRTGPYGPYMFKKDITGPKRKFVGVPNGVNIQAVTESDLVRIFQEELKKKARSGSYGNKKGTAAGGRKE